MLFRSIGIIMYGLALCLTRIVIYILHQEVPKFIHYLFYGGISLSLFGVIVRSNKNEGDK